MAGRAFEIWVRTSPGTRRSRPPPEGHIYLKVEYQLVRVMLADILYVEGLKDYVKVHLASQPRPLLSLTSLRSMEEELPAGRFMRIHRSCIVGLDHVAAVGRGTLQVRTETLPISDGYREAVDAFFARWKQERNRPLRAAPHGLRCPGPAGGSLPAQRLSVR
jgi:two-component system response regulator LytT